MGSDSVTIRFPYLILITSLILPWELHLCYDPLSLSLSLSLCVCVCPCLNSVSGSFSHMLANTLFNLLHFKLFLSLSCKIWGISHKPVSVSLFLSFVLDALKESIPGDSVACGLRIILREKHTFLVLSICEFQYWFCHFIAKLY